MTAVRDCEHGTAAGYRCHLRHKERPCAECKSAWRRYITAYRQKGKSRG